MRSKAVQRRTRYTHRVSQANAILLKAATVGDLDLLREGLSGGASTEKMSPSGLRPLAIAARIGWVEGVRALLAAGAKVDACDCEGNTALMTAVAFGRHECLPVLVEAGAQLNLQNHWGLVRAAGGTDPSANKFWAQERKNLLRWIREGRYESGSHNAWTAVMMAVANDDRACLRRLLSLGAQVEVRCSNARGDPGATALWFAAKWGRLECVKDLACAGADLNVRSDNRVSAAAVASRWGRDNIVAFIEDVLKARSERVVLDTETRSGPLLWSQRVNRI